MVREILKEEKTLVQIASKHGIHPQQLTGWKAIALKGLPNLFENGRKTEAKIRSDYEQQQQELYAEIGKLTPSLYPKGAAVLESRLFHCFYLLLLLVLKQGGFSLPMRLPYAMALCQMSY